MVNGATDLVNAWVRGLTHRARLVCAHCEGRGQVQTVGNDLSVVEDCQACEATGSIEVGCGGAAERDLNHPQLAYCVTEGVFVDPEEIPWPEVR